MSDEKPKDESPKVINAFTRKAFEAPKETTEVVIKICEGSLRLAEEILRQIKTGETVGLGVIGLHRGYPMTALVRAEDEDVARLSKLNLASDTLKDQVLERVAGYMRPAAITEDGLEDSDDE